MCMTHKRVCCYCGDKIDHNKDDCRCVWCAVGEMI